MRVRTHLSLLAAAVFLPMIVGAGVAIKLLLDAERHAVLRGMQELARASVLAMDQELTAAIATGQALQTSGRLTQANFPDFYRQARAANAGTRRETAVLSEDGRQLFNTALPLGQPIPAPAPGTLQRVRAVFERNRPTVSNLIVGSSTHKYVISVELPLTLDDGRRVLLDQWFDARHLNSLLPRDVAPGWQVAVFDREGATLARNQSWDTQVGLRAQPELLRAVRAGASRTDVVGHDGVPTAAVLARSALSGWTAVIAVPVGELETTAAHAVSLIAATLLCAVVLALAGAILFARRLLAATEYLGAATEGMAEGWLPPPADLRIAELNSLQQVLHAVSRRLQKAETGRRKHLAEVQAARSVAEAQNRAKDEFLAMLGHELRNPLGAISSAIALIQMGAGGTAAERAHQIIGRQSRHLAHLVDELLDANRVLSGKVVLALTPLDLAGAVREAALTLQTQGATAEHHVELDLEPVWACCDPTRLQQVIGNLVENAAKYTQAGGHIRVSTRKRDGMAELVVADDGKGIDAELLPRIWDVFVQGKVVNRTKGGLGIGLAVVKSLVEQQHGTVAVHSGGAQCGSTFTIRLPLAAEAPPVPDAAPLAPRSLEGLRVLVVEDNEDLREMMCALLGSSGCAVSSAADGRSAIRLAGRCLPQVAFIDIDLPDISGHEVARALAEQGGIRLVAVTGYGQAEDVRRALAAGFDRHLKKPVRLEDLERAVGELDLVR
ncbi:MULTISPECIES: hybrid sensor histidine kinase/response regulator [unclassified Massilia]|uniref:hybrid sensor histidine kinase/response regulator n=1 Tax=unclassified Massilia TaxID=2609279 RepID=UPI000A51225A|nr:MULTISPECIES: hybrid sensor histidine kinase/response regulator [unclassified Massilia]